MGARLRVSPWVLSEAGRLLRSGMAQLEVAVAVGIGLSTLQRYLTNDDVAMFQERKRRSDALTLGQREEIRVGIEHRRSDGQIAARIGRHRSTVWREIADNAATPE
jgi:DNA-binding CsgD family transcriptional regulator